MTTEYAEIPGLDDPVTVDAATAATDALHRAVADISMPPEVGWA